MSKEFKGQNKFFIHNLVFHKGEVQQYGKNYFTSLEEFIEFCPFQLLSKTQTDFETEGYIETSAIFKI